MRVASHGRRVVITGMGAVTSLGSDLDAIWNAIVSGQSGIRPIRQYGETTPPRHIAGQVDLDALPAASTLLSPSSGVVPETLGRAARFGLLAACRAWSHAGFDGSPPDGATAGVSIGASTFPIIEDRIAHVGDLLDGNAWDPVRYARLCRENPSLLVQSDAAAIASLIADRFGLRALSLTAQAACTSATQALGFAFHALRSGQATVLLAGGADSMLSMMCVTGFSLLGSLSQNWQEPTRASRPFDSTRDGFVLAEGASILVLEDLHAEILGYGSSLDAYRFTDMHPEGDGAVLCMNAAMRDAGIRPEDVAYINAHGTATPLNDRTETKAIRRTFGAHADWLAVSSTKSQIGHLLCAAGAIEATLTVLALERGLLPPTINLDHPDPECDLDYIPWTARPADARIGLSNSFGFGGQNGTLVFKRWEPVALKGHDFSRAEYSAKSARALALEGTPTPPTRRVYITGLGVFSPLGANVHDHLARFDRGESAIRPTTSPQLRALGIPRAARACPFDAHEIISNRMLRKILTSAASHAVAAAGEALRSANLSADARRHSGLFVGSLGLDQDLNLFGEALRVSLDGDHRFSYARFERQGEALLDPLFLVKSLPNAGICGAAIEFDLQGPNLNIMNGPSSGLLAVAAAARAVAAGEVPIALAGGYDSPLQLEIILAHLIDNRLETTSNTGQGYVLGEGAACFVLEDEAHARARGATIYAEITGVAQSHSAPGEAMESLLATARSAMEGAAMETRAPAAIFGDGLNLPAPDGIEHAAAGHLDASAAVQSATHLTGYCGVASPLFSLLHAVHALHARRSPSALIWTSDRQRDHVAIALCCAGNEVDA
jgi:3-oxoacyl-[acyl-carrier-protein] synthase II